MLNMLANGIYDNLPNDEYHADSAVSSSTLKIMASKTPAHAKAKTNTATQATTYGAAVHTALLEPEKFDAQVIRGYEDRRGKRWKDAQEDADARGCVLLTSSEYDTISALRASLQANKLVCDLLGGNGVNEQSAFWTDDETDLRCRVRPDRINYDMRLMIDVKTTVSAASYDFQKSITKYGYHLQQAMYLDGYAQHGIKLKGFVFIAIEKTPPFACAVYQLDDDAEQAGYELYRGTLKRYAECKASGVWDSYPQEIQEIKLQSYSFRLDEATEDSLVEGMA